jgi:hypothetical protein
MWSRSRIRQSRAGSHATPGVHEYLSCSYKTLGFKSLVRITRDIGDPPTDGHTWKQRWNGSDLGLIAAWEGGIRISNQDPFLADCARQGHLVVLSWQGGVKRRLKKDRKYGSLKYLAMWRGLRGEPLEISLIDEVTLTCTLTKMKITYTPDRAKYVAR